MKELETRKILRKYRHGQCSSDEKMLIESWYEKKEQEKTGNTEKLDLTELGKNIWKAIVVEVQKRKLSLRKPGNFRFRI